MGFNEFMMFINEIQLSDNNIKEVQKIVTENEKVFILILGGSGSGKNWLKNKFFSFLPLCDVDEEIAKLGDERENLSKAIKNVNYKILGHLEKGTSFVFTGTGANLKGTENRILRAKNEGFKIVCILRDTPINVAIRRVQKRHLETGRPLIPEFKIKKTNENAKTNFKFYSQISDFSMVYV